MSAAEILHASYDPVDAPHDLPESHWGAWNRGRFVQHQRAVAALRQAEHASPSGLDARSADLSDQEKDAIRQAVLHDALAGGGHQRLFDAIDAIITVGGAAPASGAQDPS
ncbi:hypothetical protein [Nocardioides sp. Leaf285]|uniref:hypothetical protein n=1 Tax=Nocardioides sp. Leaf285 TaxID=1736322 RepID=UPI0007034F53|nr:hypothetical protein [Nocardioides sp. Leaf285]KQP62990.1 hypothetical protein ASF47_18435 [Nocardioides sp. Leaf285]